MPDFSQHPAPVLAQNEAKVLIGVSPSDESGGEIINSFLSFEASDHFVRSMNVVARVGLRQHLLKYRRICEIITLDSGVRPESHVLNSHQVAHVIEMIHDVLYGHRLRALDHECDTGNSHNSASLGQL